MELFEVQLELESACFLNCIHCSSQAMRRSTRTYSDEDVLRFLCYIPLPLEVFFTGGEPLLYPGLLALCSEVHEQRPDCEMGILTSGIVSEHGALSPVSSVTLESLHRVGVNIAYVSLYSDTPAWHDEMTNKPGSFNLTVRAIQNMVQLGMDTRINLVITRQNVHRLPEIIRFASELGVGEVRPLKLVCHGSAAAHWAHIGLSDADYAQAVVELYQHRQNLPTRITVSSMPRLAPCRPVGRSEGCQAGKRLLYVALSGEVYPCACVKNNRAASLGNIREPALESIVNKSVPWGKTRFRCLREMENETMENQEC